LSRHVIDCNNTNAHMDTADDRPAAVRAEELARDAEHARKKGRFLEAADLHTGAAQLFGVAARAVAAADTAAQGTVTPTCTAALALRGLVDFHLSQA
jgi:hypothetical protein